MSEQQSTLDTVRGWLSDQGAKLAIDHPSLASKFIDTKQIDLLRFFAQEDVVVTDGIKGFNKDQKAIYDSVLGSVQEHIKQLTSGKSTDPETLTRLKAFKEICEASKPPVDYNKVLEGMQKNGAEKMAYAVTKAAYDQIKMPESNFGKWWDYITKDWKADGLNGFLKSIVSVASNAWDSLDFTKGKAENLFVNTSLIEAEYKKQIDPEKLTTEAGRTLVSQFNAPESIVHPALKAVYKQSLIMHGMSENEAESKTRVGIHAILKDFDKKNKEVQDIAVREAQAASYKNRLTQEQKQSAETQAVADEQEAQLYEGLSPADTKRAKALEEMRKRVKRFTSGEGAAGMTIAQEEFGYSDRVAEEYGFGKWGWDRHKIALAGELSLTPVKTHLIGAKNHFTNRDDKSVTIAFFNATTGDMFNPEKDTIPDTENIIISLTKKGKEPEFFWYNKPGLSAVDADLASAVTLNAATTFVPILGWLGKGKTAAEGASLAAKATQMAARTTGRAASGAALEVGKVYTAQELAEYRDQGDLAEAALGGAAAGLLGPVGNKVTKKVADKVTGKAGRVLGKPQEELTAADFTAAVQQRAQTGTLSATQVSVGATAVIAGAVVNGSHGHDAQISATVERNRRKIALQAENEAEIKRLQARSSISGGNEAAQASAQTVPDARQSAAASVATGAGS